MEIHRKLQREHELDFFSQYEGVVYGVLKRLAIHQLHPHYDDFAQIGRLKLVEAYEAYPDDPFQELNRGRFVGYAFTKIRWAIIDEIRRQNRYADHEQGWDDSLDHILSTAEICHLENVLEQEWLIEVFKPLCANERRLIVDLCFHHLSITAIAKKEGVSRKTIYQRRNRIKEKLQIKYCNKKGAPK